MSNFFRPILGISTGDPNGIGIEVILKSLEKMRERGLISEENYLKKLKEFGY